MRIIGSALRAILKQKKAPLVLAAALIVSFPLAAQTALSRWPLVVGTGDGLYAVSRVGTAVPLWTGGSVRKIIRAGAYWFLQSGQGIFMSADLRHWEDRSRGLPVKTIKVYDRAAKSFITRVQEIKDMEINPDTPEILVCATKDTVFLSRDRGLSWQSLGPIPARTNGVKAVAAVNLPELTVFLSHSIYGLYYIHPDRKDASWAALNVGLERLETTDNPDEVSDIAAVPGRASSLPDVYVSQTFRQRIYRLDWERKRFIPVFSDGGEAGAADSLSVGEETIRFVREGAIMEISRPGSLLPVPKEGRRREDIAAWITVSGRLGLKPDCAAVWGNGFFLDTEPVILSELWLLDEALRPQSAAFGREGLYLPVDRVLESASLQPFLDLMAERKLDMAVIDMKDDYGRLRFTPEDPAVSEKGRVFRPLDIDVFLKTMKERGIYTAARIVVFKDPELAGKEEEKYSIWDSRTGRAWQGYYDTRRQKLPPGQRPANGSSSTAAEILPSSDPAYEILRTYYDERWVDPYSEEVWEYIAAVAAELHRRGFDEIQFDYIRFPTDGDNLGSALYRWQDPGMDMESAMLSFLRHVRSRITAPISIDIYGANGWYRTGARTGQEVELLAQYVDVISPMYYPSHFEQDFLAQDPPELRPYRIYYLGARRTHLIARGRIIVRPYVQAFFLNVAYDRRYYNADYVLQEVRGVRDAGGFGLTYWNNSGRYDDIPMP
jgi:hypothetical protein